MYCKQTDFFQEHFIYATRFKEKVGFVIFLSNIKMQL